MQALVVVDNPKTWTLKISDVPVISGREYLTAPRYTALRRLRVFNLCRSYRYQSIGYYVSLLAVARGHVPLPSVTTIQDMRSGALARVVAGELDELIEHKLRRLKSDRFTLSVYFGRNLAQQYDELANKLFRLFQTPLLRAWFARGRDGWRLERVRPIPASEIPDAHLEFVAGAAQRFFEKGRVARLSAAPPRYDLAVLCDEAERTPPSDERALERLVAVGKRLRLGVELIDKQDYNRLAEFDGLFIRETTGVNHHTYRFARRALAEGLVVIDDPESIIKCCNKVYLAQLLDRHRIAIPRTVVLHRENKDDVLRTMDVPAIIKQPDSSFSQGVFKVADRAQFDEVASRLLEDSELLVVQEFLPTDYDWRIGVLNREPLYACKYFMVKAHWQIARTDASQTSYGETETVALENVPEPVLKLALRAANAIGDGLYGVDVKLMGTRAVVIEVNDNPNIDASAEALLLKDELYRRIWQVFIDRIERVRRNGAARGKHS